MYKIEILCSADMPTLIRQLWSQDYAVSGNRRFYINKEFRDCDYLFLYRPIEVEKSTITFSCQNSSFKRRTAASISYSPWFTGAKLLSSNSWGWDKGSTLEHEGFLQDQSRVRHEKFAVISKITSDSIGAKKYGEFSMPLVESEFFIVGKYSLFSFMVSYNNAINSKSKVIARSRRIHHRREVLFTCRVSNKKQDYYSIRY